MIVITKVVITILCRVLFQTSKSDNCNLYELHQGVDGQSQVEADGSSEVGKKGAFASSIGLLKINFLKVLIIKTSPFQSKHFHQRQSESMKDCLLGIQISFLGPCFYI